MTGVTGDRGDRCCSPPPPHLHLLQVAGLLPGALLPQPLPQPLLLLLGTVVMVVRKMMVVMVVMVMVVMVVMVIKERARLAVAMSQ